jgi:hypothetical protein
MLEGRRLTITAKHCYGLDRELVGYGLRGPHVESDRRLQRRCGQIRGDRYEILRQYALRGRVPVPCRQWFDWAEWFERANRTVGWTHVTETVDVSTIFLGLDCNYLAHGPPILFETMVFGGPLNGLQWRYSTWSEAEEGHDTVLVLAKAAAEGKQVNRTDFTQSKGAPS